MPTTPRMGVVLSLTGRFARFGRRAADALHLWNRLSGDPVRLRIVDDGGVAARVAPALEDLAAGCDLLLGPYSTVLMREAAAFARDSDRLVWNHGGSGDDAQTAAARRVVSVLTPTSRYAETFVRYLARHHPGLGLRLVHGSGSFGRQVVDGARDAAARHGVAVVDDPGAALFTAGTFEEDVAVVSALPAGPGRPPVIGTVAAGVHGFGRHVPDPDGVLGVAQWTPGARAVQVGPDEAEFVRRYRAVLGTDPDYPAVQAVAAAALARHCATLAGSTAADDLWRTAAALRTTTLYGAFAIDAPSGAQTGHGMELVQWRDGRMSPLR
ncbi:ABC transporter substrate-binding protein [Pseudonocardia sp. KRD291]|uniref:ABC transporter substrate-binding protein n=1 Tax=Pseudonocardia sp. KRD291 TaxID=2792007 RepID=UPI001C4A6A29|nr:ABC transporter substrate-binding protein [Pseudonocardia sp. KRD291]MBW0102108.1 ABC transporter substrate-binding protein [Pseudonocardia sp. KRD291]